MERKGEVEDGRMEGRRKCIFILRGVLGVVYISLRLLRVFVICSIRGSLFCIGASQCG